MAFTFRTKRKFVARFPLIRSLSQRRLLCLKVFFTALVGLLLAPGRESRNLWRTLTLFFRTVSVGSRKSSERLQPGKFFPQMHPLNSVGPSFERKRLWNFTYLLLFFISLYSDFLASRCSRANGSERFTTGGGGGNGEGNACCKVG